MGVEQRPHLLRQLLVLVQALPSLLGRALHDAQVHKLEHNILVRLLEGAVAMLGHQKPKQVVQGVSGLAHALQLW